MDHYSGLTATAAQATAQTAAFAVPGNYPTFVNAYGNGIIYTVTTEHTIETPLFKGSLARALNATTGAEIWTTKRLYWRIHVPKLRNRRRLQHMV